MTESKRLTKKILALIRELTHTDVFNPETQRALSKGIEELLDDTVAPGPDKP